MAIIPNKEQQRAIDILNGSVMLLAGKKKKKTFTIIQRIEHMLSKGIEPSSILCLTFSDAAANEMRQRPLKNLTKQFAKQTNLQKSVFGLLLQKEPKSQFPEAITNTFRMATIR